MSAGASSTYSVSSIGVLNSKELAEHPTTLRLNVKSAMRSVVDSLSTANTVASIWMVNMPVSPKLLVVTSRLQSLGLVNVRKDAAGDTISEYVKGARPQLGNGRVVSVSVGSAKMYSVSIIGAEK